MNTFIQNLKVGKVILDSTPFLHQETSLNQSFDRTAASVGLGGLARARADIDADRIPVATIYANSTLRTLTVTLSDFTRTANVNAMGAPRAQRARLESG